MFKRKRVYAGPRLTFKRRRVSKRRSYGRRPRQTAYASSSKGNVSTLGFARKRGGYTKYKRQLWDASTLHTHYRSYFGYNATTSSPASHLTMQTATIGLVADSFWLAPGGAVVPLTPASNSDLYIRGGLSTLTFNNDSATNLAITVYTVRTTKNGSVPAASTPTLGWDPSTVVDFQQYYVVTSKKAFHLATNETMVLQRKVRTQKIDSSMFNNGFERDFWLFTVASLAVGVAGSVEASVAHNISYTIET